MNVKHKCNNEMKYYTDLKQSRRLGRLLPADSADLHYVRMTHDFKGNPVDGKWSHPRYGNPNSWYANYLVQDFEIYEVSPCWSLATLIELLSMAYIEFGRIKLPNYKPHKSNFQFWNNEDGTYEFVTTFHTSKGDCLTDAVVNQIEWLVANEFMTVENGKLKMEE